jgi:hypothetical protein
MATQDRPLATQVSAPADRTATWLPLLVSLTSDVPRWLVWKNAESAFTGTGDIDAAAPPEDWPRIIEAFRAWALERDLGPVIVCRHIPGGLNLIAVPSGWPTFLEMGTKARRIWRGATLFVLEDIEPLAVLDERGFRRLRPGAEGLFKLLLNGTRRNGLPDEAALAAKQVRELLRADPAGAAAAAGLYGVAAGPLRRAARAAAAGGWDRPALLAFQGSMLVRAALHPGVLWARLRFRLRGRRACPIAAAILDGDRRIPEPRDAWLARVAVDHEIHRAAGSAVSPRSAEGRP